MKCDSKKVVINEVRKSPFITERTYTQFNTCTGKTYGQYAFNEYNYNVAIGLCFILLFCIVVAYRFIKSK